MNQARKTTDSILGYFRNYTFEEKNSISFNFKSKGVCQFFILLDYCPINLFSKKKQSSCKKIHDKIFKDSFSKLHKNEKIVYYQNCKEFIENRRYKIENTIERILKEERISKNISKKFTEEYLNNQIKTQISDLKILLLKEKSPKEKFFIIEKINFLDEKITSNGEKKNKLKELKFSISDSKKTITIKGGKICLVCGAVILDNDNFQRGFSHLNGNSHINNFILLESLDKIEKILKFLKN